MPTRVQGIAASERRVPGYKTVSTVDLLRTLRSTNSPQPRGWRNDVKKTAALALSLSLAGSTLVAQKDATVTTLLSRDLVGVPHRF